MTRILLTACLFAVAASVDAQGPVSPEIEGKRVERPAADLMDFTGTDTGADTSSADLEAFVDGVVAAYMESARLAGATVAVVRGNDTLLLKGYGIRDGNHNPVDPENTLFRIASISKTFIWTALMQLVERGEIALDEPVNEYLPVSLHLPGSPGGEPIRIRHLMTHSAGFEDSALGHLIERDSDRLRPLDEYLIAARPALVREPDVLSSYSNYASALAGALVAHVSGQSFESYVEDHIFAPLGMARSTFREPYDPGKAAAGLPAPAPKALAERFAEGFRDSEGSLEPAYFEHLAHTAPSGGMSASAGDMARYMKALLGGGRLGDGTILRAPTVRLMQETLFASAEGVNGLAHGFIEYRLPGGLRGFGHGGALLHFFSGMVLVPDLDLGVFVSTNTAGGREFTNVLPERIVARYAVEIDKAPHPPADFIAYGKRYAGSYRNTRRSYTRLEKLAAIDSVVEVSLHPDGYLVTHGSGPARRWVALDDSRSRHLFQRVDGPERIAFGENAAGDITYIYHASGINAGERIGYFSSQHWLLLISGLVGLAAVWQLGSTWTRRRTGVHQSPGEAGAAILMPLWAAAWLIFLLLFTFALARITNMGSEALFAWPTPALMAAVVAANLAAGLSLLAAISLIPVWHHRRWSLRRRLYHGFSVLAGIALVFTLNEWNVIGWRL
jgi:CubicO group peptidase (beta-lactamase class C family)